MKRWWKDTWDVALFVSIIVTGLIVMGFMFNDSDWQDQYRIRCEAEGGDVVELARSNRLCVDEDGRIIPVPLNP